MIELKGVKIYTNESTNTKTGASIYKFGGDVYFSRD
uniref:Uncharacterized protein n=1 Tax=viral metagenome TaxID=1070528 RepID=A0A6C0CMF7_9ZZZZ